MPSTRLPFVAFIGAAFHLCWGCLSPLLGLPFAFVSAAFCDVLHERACIAGQKRAREMWFLARMYNAEQALNMGLVNTVVPLDRLETETLVWYVYLFGWCCPPPAQLLPESGQLSVQLGPLNTNIFCQQ